MVTEQKKQSEVLEKQGQKIEALEKQPLESVKDFKKSMISAVVGALMGAIIAAVIALL